MPRRRSRSGDIEIFLKYPIRLQGDYLAGVLTYDEFFLLFWLWLGANPYRGAVRISYKGLHTELHGRHSINKLNKIVLSLRSKKYLSFPKRQGRRGAFEALLDRYPLASGEYISITKERKKRCKTSPEPEETVSKSPEEIAAMQQNIDTIKKDITKRFSVNRPEPSAEVLREE